jgi:putative transposase
MMVVRDIGHVAKPRTELKNRGVNDIFIACVDGLKGFPETIEAIYPHTEVQLCIVHLVRASLNYVPWKHRKLVAADLRRDLSCGHGGGSQAESGGGNSEVDRLSQRQPSVAVELGVGTLHRSLRKIIKTRGAFPNEESTLKLLFLSIRQASKKWTMQNWSQALNYFTVLWPDRMPQARSVGIMHLSSFLRGRKGRGTVPLPLQPIPNNNSNNNTNNNSNTNININNEAEVV